MKGLTVCDGLCDSENEIETWKYCAPIFISCAFFGTLLHEEKTLAPDKEIDPRDYSEDMVRSGTVTFVTYKNEAFAITCKHVIEVLEKQQQDWKKEQLKEFDFAPPIEGVQLYTPIDNYQYHFNYKFSLVPKRDNGTQPDIAIARVKLNSIKRLGRKPLSLFKKNNIPETGVASGYPEQQRIYRKENKVDTFSPMFTTCVASLQITGNGNIILEGNIESHNEVDSLSGMSGGPILWSDSKKFGIVGIVKKGSNIKPIQGGLAVENNILIHAEKITPEIFDGWLEHIPELLELKDETKHLYIPSGMQTSE